MTRQQIQFLTRVTPPALQSEREFEIPACVTIAQAVLESATPLYGWGSSRLFRLANNPFGIKASHFNGLEKYGHFDAETIEYRPTLKPAQAFSAAATGTARANGQESLTVGASAAGPGSPSAVLSMIGKVTPLAVSAPAPSGAATAVQRQLAPTPPVAVMRPKVELAQFQRFPSLAEAFTAHARLLMSAHYRPAYELRHDWKQFAERLGPKTSATDTDHCGYSTNPGYSAQLVRIVETCRLDDPRALEWLESGKDPGPVLEKLLA